MTSFVERNLHVLETLKRANPNLRSAIIANADPELIEAISEICHNYVSGNILCEKQHFNDLKKHKTAIRALAKGKKVGSNGTPSNTNADYSADIDRKRDILLQKGEGFWDAILIPLMTELGTHFLHKIVQKTQKDKSLDGFDL